MPLPAPNLDDRTFDQLVREGIERVRRSAPSWTDLTPGDPGVVLLELFAFLADTTIYRLNQVPDKLYVEFLRLIGVHIEPPTAATVDLVFTRERDTSRAIELPRGTRVTTKGPAAGSDSPVFATLEAAVIDAGETATTVRAMHAQTVEGELLGRSTGAPGQWFRLARPPVIAPSGQALDLVLAVESTADELRGSRPAIEFDGRPFRIWREVDHFADLGAEEEAFIADRSGGILTLAPALRMRVERDELESVPRALAAVPVVDREIRAWYRHGGGSEGNVQAGTLTVLRDPIEGVGVTNPAPATGGRDTESLDHAKARGPQELRSLSRAVTARDFELVAQRSTGAIARAHAYTQRSLWRWATPGTVELVIVPAVPDAEGSHRLSAAQLASLQSPESVRQVQHAVDSRRPLGTACVVSWARYKSVRVRAEVVVQREEDSDAVRRRVDERLHRSLGPLPSTEGSAGWPFGQALYASLVYRIILAEPGVRHARGVRLVVDSAPDRDVEAITADVHQASTWYAGSGETLYRSLNDGDGWEPMGEFRPGVVQAVDVCRDVPGLVAAATILPDGTGSSVHVSRDSGESWTFSRPFGFRVEDLAWVMRDAAPLLLMAAGPSGAGSGGGLYQLAITPDADPVQVLVDASDQDRPFYAVTAFQEVRGDIAVAVAAQARGGVYLSKQAGHADTFVHIGLAGEDVRVLEVQADGPRAFLWAGTAAPGGEQTGKGCFRRELLGADDPVEGWQHHGQGWIAGSCWALAFDGPIVLAATQQYGVMHLDMNQPNPAWTDPTQDVQNGLPLRDLNRFLPVHAVAVSPEHGRIMAGGPKGVYRSVGRDATGSPGLPHYEDCSAAEHPEEVTIPPTWLFVCGENELIVRSDASG